MHVIFFHSLLSRVGCHFQGKLFFTFRLLYLVFARHYLSSRSALMNCVIFVNGLRYSWENLFADTRFVLLTQAITYPGSASVQCGLYRRTEYPLSHALTFHTQASVSYWTLLSSRKSCTCTSTAVQSFWAAVNAAKLLNLHVLVLELFVTYMAISTASWWGHKLKNTGRWREGCIITCTTGMDSYYVLEKKIIFLHLLIFFTYWLDCRFD